MKNLKKIVAVLVMVLLIGGLTACNSTSNEIANNFEEQGYARYTYNNKGDSLTFALHDALYSEELATYMEEHADEFTTQEGQTTTSEDGEDGEDGDVTVTQENRYFGFTSYVFSNSDYAVVVMEFDSETLLREKLDESTALVDYFDGLSDAELEEYINGNCLLVVLDPYVSESDYFIDIFQGRLEPTVTE